MQISHFVGIDISKETLDAALYPARDRKTDFLHFANSSKGLGEMMSWLKSRGVKSSELLICAEHTGIYTNTLIAFAHKKGIALSLNSPLDIKRSIGLARGKKDYDKRDVMAKKEAARDIDRAIKNSKKYT